MDNKKEKRISPYSIKFWTNKGYSEDEAKYQISIRRPTNINYWLNKGHSEEEAKEKVYIQSTKSTGKKTLIKLYGEEEGKKRFDELIKKRRISSKRCIEYWLNKGHSEEEAKEKLSEHQNTFTIDKCIKKYGEKAGRDVYKTRQINWINKIKNKPKEEIDRINKLKSASSVEYYIEKYKDKWKEEYFKKRLGRIDVSIIKYKIIMECKNIEDVVTLVKKNIKEYDYRKFKQICYSKLVQKVLNWSDDVSKKILRLLMSEYNIPNRNGIYGRMVIYKSFVFKSYAEYKLCLFLESKNIDFEYDKIYPKQKLPNKLRGIRYDFFIKTLNLYIEYAGLMNNESYRKRMNDKKKFCIENNLNLYISSSLNDIEKYILGKLNEKNDDNQKHI
jgi:hypothetical protein